MTRLFPLFTLWGVTTRMSPISALLNVGVAAILSWGAARQLAVGPGPAALAGSLLTLCILLTEWLHQMGHARAARATGYPMQSIDYIFAMLAISRYPATEPELPAALHIRRALGGFWVNLVIALILAPYAMLMWMQGTLAGWVLGWTALTNLLWTVLSFVPMDIPGWFATDGGTLLRYWRKR